VENERWQKIEHIYHAALEKDPSDRAEFVKQACGGDESLAQEVLSLLAEEGLTDEFLKVPALQVAAKAIALSAKVSGERSPVPSIPAAIGPYRVIRLLGEGGMGLVLLAEQSAPVRRDVALKLIRASFFDSSVLQRFQSEQQSLAVMNHPAIAKVFDAGTTSDGQPYFVMEYVNGPSITKYCDGKKLKIRERLELFIKVCEGVQHAHQKAIIHRDLKPSNVLVEELDGKPVPRIIDFGIAKAISSQPGSDQTMFTQAGALVGTPGYMSPEQCDPGVLDVDTRADVYSLGIILYVLLTGMLPFDTAQWKKRPLDEILRQLREEDPPSPSTKLNAEGQTATIAAQTRDIEPGQLARLLQGDLDWITLKAVERDRSRRYGTPSELAADIQRYLDNEPVVARPASAGYRLQKYVRRHRIGVSVAAGLVLLLTTFVFLQAAELRRITRERDRANRITDFMTTMFKVSDPSEARGNSVTAREVLDKASKNIDTTLSKDPDLQGHLMTVMGTVYEALGLYSQAESLHERAVDIMSKNIGPNQPETLITQGWVAWDLARQGRYADAEKLSRSVLETQRRVVGPDDPHTLETMYNLGWILHLERRPAEAEKLDRETLERRTRVLGPEHPRTLASMSNLAVDLGMQHKFSEAISLQKQTLEIQRRVLGAEAPDTLWTMTNLANSYLRQGNYADAEKLQRETLDIERRVLGPEHPNTLRIMINLGATLNNEKRFKDAEALEIQTLEIGRRVLGPEHPDVMAITNNLSRTLSGEGRTPESLALLRQIVATQRRVYGPTDQRTLDTAADLSSVLSDLGQFVEAKEILEDVFANERRAFGTDNPTTSLTEYNLACLAARSKHPKDALSLLSDAVDHHLAPDALLGIDQDTDLNSLHGNPEFAAIVTRAKQLAASAGKPQ
jgi:serine/threonine protein kinase